MSLFTCVKKQLPESDGNGETSLGETNPLDVTLDYIAEDLLLFFNGVKSLRGAKEKIEKKYDIKKEHGDYWPADDIKRAWEKTQRMNIKSSRRRYWAHVIILQMLKRFMVYDERKPNAAQEDHDDTTNETKQSCETRPGMKENSEDRSSQSKAELETVDAAGGDEQMFGAGKKLSEVSKLSEDSGVASESQHSASSTDVAPSLTEVNPIANSNNSETKNAALVNEDEDTLVNNNDQRKDVDDYELYVEDMHDPENEILEDCLWSTDDINQACGRAESIKGNSEDRSSQVNDELKTETAAEGVEGVIGSQGGTGTHFPTGSQETVNSQAGADVSAVPSDDEKNMDIVDEYNYICIPLSMFGSKLPIEPLDINTNTDPNADTNSKYTYKLINQFPSNTQQHCMYGKTSYVMLYDTDKKNAKWVYEIMNKSTVPFQPKKVNFKKDDNIDDDKQALESKNGFVDKDYVRGHLAAAANHKWCQKAYNDTYLISNMTPQLTSINNGIWKTLESYCREIIYEDDKICNVHVYTGPLYLNNNEGSTMEGKAVPTHYFKIVIVENENGKAKVECYMVENKKKESKTTDNISTDSQQQKKREKIDLHNYSLDIKTFEEISGLTFTHKSDNNRVTVKKTMTCIGENESKRATIEVKCLQ